jgi:serine/threonine protein kinase
VAQVLAGIAEAVDAAHRMGVLHRDLKPENVLVSDDERAVKVLDFGVAKLMDAETAGQTLTLDGQPIGTPAYMAPEQLVGGAVTTRTDVFALGVMAYEMVSGQTPFGLGPIGDIALRQRDGAPPLEADRVPGRMADAIAAAISVDPVQRPASAAAFAAMLQ